MERLFVLWCVVSSLVLAGPAVGPERPVAPAVPGPVSTGDGVAAARGAHGTLVVWRDAWSAQGRRVVAARLDAQGVALDRPFLDVGVSAPLADQVAVAWDGSRYVIVWSSYRTVYLRRLTEQGAFVDAAELRVGTAGSTVTDVKVASDGSGQSLVVWYEGSKVAGVRLSPAGAVLDPSPLTLVASGYQPAAVAFDGTGYLLAFPSLMGSVFGVSTLRLSTAGTVGPTTRLGNTTGNQVAVSCTGATCLVAASSGHDVLAWSLVSGAPQPAATLWSDPAREFHLPSVAFDGADFWVLVSTSGFPNRAHVRRVSLAGVAQGAPVELDEARLGVAGVGTPLFAFSLESLSFQRLDATGVLDALGVPFAFAAPAQWGAAIASSGDLALAAWVEALPTTRVFRAARFDRDGLPLDPVPMELGLDTPDGAGTLRGTVFGVVDDGQNFLVGLSRAGRASLVRVPHAGPPLDADGGLTLGFMEEAVMVGDGQRLWLASTLANDVQVQRFTFAGAPVDAVALPLVATSAGESLPGLCFDGQQVWVSWRESVSTNRSPGFSRVSDAGVALDHALVTSAVDGRPLFFSGPTCLALWRNAAATTMLTRASPDGGLDGPSGAVSFATNTFGEPTASWNGDRWIIATSERTAVGVSSWLGTTIGPPSQLPLVVPASRLISASNARGRTWLVTERVDLQTMARRLFVSVVRDLPAGEPCSAGPDCRSGWCVDGVCCDAACAGGTNDCQACSRRAGAATDGVCGPSTGNGCDDANACSLGDVCQAGRCEGSSLISCPPPGECEAANVCAPAVGVCRATPRTDGTSCSGGSCRGGVCEPTVDAGTGGGGGTMGGGGGATGGGGGTTGGGGGATGGGGGATGGGGGATGGGGGATGGGGGATGGGDGVATESGCGCSGPSTSASLSWFAVAVLLRARWRQR